MDTIVGDARTKGPRSQGIDGWYSLVKDGNVHFNTNVRVTVPLPDEFPNRQLVTGLTVMPEGLTSLPNGIFDSLTEQETLRLRELAEL